MKQRRHPGALRPGPRATRRRILDGAGEVMSEVGLHRVTVRGILERSAISRGTFYQYFSGIDAVHTALYEHHVEGMTGAIAQAIALDGTPRERLARGVAAYLDVQVRGGRLAAMLQAESIRPESPLRSRREAALDNLVDRLDAVVFGLLGTRIDPYVYRALLIGIEGLLIHVRGCGPITAEQKDRLQAVIYAMILSTLASREHLPRA